ncbi:MAG TPA: HEAT repeat domain-containing protein [Tepidisphaeraceae bacterium]|nr:HEAT repeat domain-containing protein [Tepidisphaeraceae bacterium]
MRIQFILGVVVMSAGGVWAANPVLKSNPDWKVEIIRQVPEIHSPSVVTCAPDGRIFVAEDPMDMALSSKDPADRILCVFPDGHQTVFAEKLHAVYGMQYVDGKLYVHHVPKFSVFVDDHGVGKDRVDLIDSTNPDPTAGGFNDHIPSNFRLAMDGFFYMAVGDKGIYQCESKVDHRKAEIRGGGVLRIRPDGTDLEVYSTGTRNHLDVSINAEDEIFTYDNTDDGQGWWTRLTHMVDGGFYGYPYDYRPTDPEALARWRAEKQARPGYPYTLWRIEEYGGGSPTGAVGYNEDALPEEYRGNLFHCEWGKGNFERFVVAREGATYRVVKREAQFLTRGSGGEFRPVGATVTPDGMGFYVTDWNYGGWKAKVDAGRLIKITYNGPSQAKPKPAWFVLAAQGEKFTATTAELTEGLKHPAQSVRLVAQRRLAERPDAVQKVVALLKDVKAPIYARWSAIWTLDHIRGGKAGRAEIIAALRDADATIRMQAARQLGTRKATEASSALVTLLDDSDAAVRFRAARALGRIESAAAAGALVKRLDEKDLFARFAVFSALNRIGNTNPAAWDAVVRALSEPKAEIREGAIFAMRNAYDERLVWVLLGYVGDTANPIEGRAAALKALAPMWKQPKPWNGKWWGTQPVQGRPPAHEVEWAGTSPAGAAINAALRDGNIVIRRAAVEALVVAPDPAAAETLAKMFQSEDDVVLKRAILRALAVSKAAVAGNFVGDVLRNAKKNEAMLPDAILVAQQIGGTAMGDAIAAVIGADVPADTLVAAIEAVGRMKHAKATGVVAARLSHDQLKVAQAAASALGAIGGEEASKALIEALNEERPGVRRAAASALGAMKAISAIPALLASYKDPEMSREVTVALAAMPDLRALDVYLDGLASRDQSVREKCRNAVGAIHVEALPIIERRLDTNPLPTTVIAELQKVYTAFMGIKEWMVVGPFDGGNPVPIDLDNPQTRKALVGREGKSVKFKKVSGEPRTGMIDLVATIGQLGDVAAYGVTYIESKEDREIEFSAGADDTITLWLNGQKILEVMGEHGWSADAYAVKGQLKKGRNVLIAKIGNNGGAWQFSVAASGDRVGKLFQYDVKKLAPEAFEKYAMGHEGNADAGRKIFALESGAGCIKCHKVGSDGGEVGPSLSGVGAKYDKAKLAESVLYPSRQILDGYQQTIIRTKKGDLVAGAVRGETDQEVTLLDSAGQKIVIKKSDIKSRKFSDISLMPDGLQTGLKPEEFADLIAYLCSLKENPK